MKEPLAPCMNCKERTAENPDLGTHDCHKSCTKYKKYKDEHLKWSTGVFNERMQDVVMNDVTKKRFEKYRKEKKI